MKRAKIIHNPKAGKGDYTKKELIAILESQGFKCGYSSTRGKEWKKIEENTDFLVVAGGDGTVRKVALHMLSKFEGKIPPIALLPLGTANNISKSLGISGHAKEIISNLSKDKRKKYDVGEIKGLPEHFTFLESLGYGIFPELMRAMKAHPPTDAKTPEEEIKAAQESVRNIIFSHQASEFEIVIDGIKHTGKYLLVEVMNIVSIGPNLNLSLQSDPGDGKFEVVLIPESQREEFASYITHKLHDVEKKFIPLVIKGKDIEITSKSKILHVDDELVENKKTPKIRIKSRHAMMEFLVQ